ncbi:MAG: hypothetical protein H6592_13595 [Flavobacteriales bacterium]|nr:hypothetical protein [Flavobacteriales bacterium]
MIHRLYAIALAGLLSLSVSAQKEPVITIPFDSTANLYSYTGVVEAAGHSDSALYANARVWLIAKNGNAQFDEDIVRLKLIDKGSFSVPVEFKMGIAHASSTYLVNYSIVLEFKTDRYRYQIYRFALGGDATSTTPSQPLETLVKGHELNSMGRKANIRMEEGVCMEIDEAVRKLIEEMKVQLVKKPASDW